ncbi:MAG: Gfo/Idh/MocA family oxidoreductase [Anaerolineaceae bacterium]|nr:MAG: Gfo/Idh/MocA family oxidoreductase [Anaerolineaceae bacterium]
MLRCAVIGCGWAGRHHIETIAESNTSVLVAAVDPDPIVGEDIKSRHNIPIYTDVIELLHNVDDIDVAVVATLPDLHKPICSRLIDEGINIYCEKPVCRNSEDIFLLKEQADRKGIKFGVVFNQRYGDAVLKAKELLEKDNTVLHLITASMYQHLPDMLTSNIKEDFMLTDALCHLLDVVTYLGGSVKDAKAFANKIESELYSDVGVALQFKNGCIGTISHSNVGGKFDTQHPFQCIDLHTKESRLRIDNQFDRLTVYPHDSMGQIVYETSVFKRRDYAVSMKRACEAFLEAINEGGELPSDINAALENMKVIELIKLSINKKRGV